MKNIVLIGMPGVGKSTLGVILAKLIGYRFIDTDLIIQERCGMLLKDIIAKNGVDGFIRLENEICSQINAERSVIATGGSVVYGDGAMAHLKSIGTVVYLRESFEVISKRISDIKGRGVVARDTQTLSDIFLERSPLYERYADIVLDMSGQSVEACLEKLVLALDSLI